jgi:hypothetical protein
MTPSPSSSPAEQVQAPTQAPTPDYGQVAKDVLRAQSAAFNFPERTSPADMKTRLAAILEAPRPSDAPPGTTVIEPTISCVTLTVTEPTRTLGERYPQLEAIIAAAQEQLAGVTLVYN